MRTVWLEDEKNFTGGDELLGLDDEELGRFLLTDDEVRIKEGVWVEMHRDYLDPVASYVVRSNVHALAERYRSAKAELQVNEDKQKKTRKVRILHRATFLTFAFAASTSFPPPAFHFRICYLSSLLSTLIPSNLMWFFSP